MVAGGSFCSVIVCLAILTSVFWGEIYLTVLWKKWGFKRNHLYFYFLLCHSFTWKPHETGGIFSDYFGIKNKTGWWLHDLRKPRAVSFIFFPAWIWRFHNFMALKIMKASASFIFDAKIIRKNATSFIKFSRETVEQ